jgi:hypothetical protein
MAKKPHKRMGRPPIKHARWSVASTKLSRAELKALKAAAKKAGLDVSTFLRVKALGKDVRNG